MLGLAPLGVAPLAARKPVQFDHALFAKGVLGIAGLADGRSDAAGAAQATFGFSSTLAGHIATVGLAAQDAEHYGAAASDVATLGKLQGEVAFALQTVAEVQAGAVGVSALRLAGRAQAMGGIAVQLDSDVAFNVHVNGVLLLNGGGALAVGHAGSAGALAALRARAVYGEMPIAGLGRLMTIAEGRAATRTQQIGEAAANTDTTAVAQRGLDILPVISGAIAIGAHALREVALFGSGFGASVGAGIARSSKEITLMAAGGCHVGVRAAEGAMLLDFDADGRATIAMAAESSAPLAGESIGYRAPPALRRIEPTRMRLSGRLVPSNSGKLVRGQS